MTEEVKPQVTAEMAEGAAEAAGNAGEGWTAAEGEVAATVAKDAAGAEEHPDYAGLTVEEVRREEEFMRGIPRFNLAAFLMPPIWGPAHGVWITILFYPIWLFVDNCIYSAYLLPTPGTIITAGIVVVSLTLVTVMFSLVAGPMAAHRAAEMGVPKEKYIRRQRIWAVVCVFLGIAMLALATYYNLVFRAGVV